MIGVLPNNTVTKYSTHWPKVECQIVLLNVKHNFSRVVYVYIYPDTDTCIYTNIIMCL